MKKNPYKLHITKYSSHSLIIKNIGSEKTVLDVGCNEGYIGANADPSNKFYGLDYSRDAVKKAKKIYIDTAFYDLNNLIKLPWNRKFDSIVFGDVLEHVLFPEATLRFFAKQYLKPNGEIIISLPNVARLDIRLQHLFGNFDYTEKGILDKTHLHLYTYKTARELAKKASLKIIREYGTSKLFGALLYHVPVFRNLLAGQFILICRKP